MNQSRRNELAISLGERSQADCCDIEDKDKAKPTAKTEDKDNTISRQNVLIRLDQKWIQLLNINRMYL